jgi:hypothetical protein
MPTQAQLEQTAKDWPPELYLDGPVPDGEELLQRTVAKVHRHSARSARIRIALFATAVVMAAAAFVGTGVVVGRLMPGPQLAERVVTATDPLSGAHLTVTMTSADDGTRMTVTVTGLPVGTVCHLTFIAKDGTRMPDNGSWRIPPDAADRPIQDHVWMAESDLAAIEVTTSTNARVVADVAD